jgi:hypothetical protein
VKGIAMMMPVRVCLLEELWHFSSTDFLESLSCMKNPLKLDAVTWDLGFRV